MKRSSKIILIATLAVATLLVSVALAGSRSRAWLGVTTEDVDREIAQDYSLPGRSGAIINDVIRRSPADDAGLEEDDVILAFNGDQVRDSDDLTDFIDDSRPGDSVTLTVFRNGKEQKIAVELGRRSKSSIWWSGSDNVYVPKVPAVPPVPPVPAVPDIRVAPFGKHNVFYVNDDSPYMGVTLIELSEEAAQALGAAKGGVLINEVERDSPAEEAGIKPGDIIVEFDGDKVFETEDVTEVIDHLDDGDTVSVSLVRDRKPLTVKVILEYYDDDWRDRRHGSIWIPDLSGRRLGEARESARHYAKAATEYKLQAKGYQKEMQALQQDLRKMRTDLGGMKKICRDGV